MATTVPSTPVRRLGLVFAAGLVAGTSFTAGIAVASGWTDRGQDAEATLVAAAQAGPQFQFVERARNPGPSSAFQNSVTCPLGFRAIAGGGLTSASNLAITDSYRSSSPPRQWVVRWETDDSVVADPATVTTQAVCLRR
jgi:hypothetical protein